MQLRPCEYRLLGLLLAASCLTAPASAADWSMAVGRDPARGGLSPDLGPTDPAILWQGSRPAIVAQQGVAAGNLLVVNRIANFDVATGTLLVAHDLTTGAEQWAVHLPVDPNAWREKVMAIRDGHIYATRGGDTKLGFIYALDPATGGILWTSQDKTDESTTESPAFAPDGDLIVGNFGSIRRVNHLNGATVWTATRSAPTTDGQGATVFGSRVYSWEASAFGPKVTAFDLATGNRLYSSRGLGGGFVQQLGLFAGPDGTVYAPRTQNNAATDSLFALADIDTGFADRWRVPLGYVPFASFAIGPDGSVYSYNPSRELVRLDAATGAVLNTSMVIPADFPMQPRMAADAAGRVYLTNGGFGQGRVFSFNADLTLRWSQAIANVNLGGPVLAGGGTMVVCGVGNDVRAYRTASTAVAGAGGQAPLRLALEQNVPNPFNPATRIGFDLAGEGRVALAVYDAGGRRVRTLIAGEPRAAGHHEVVWRGVDERGAPVPSGVYFYRLEAGGAVESRKMLLIE